MTAERTRASTSRRGSSAASASASAGTVAILAYHRVGPLPPGSWETWYLVSSDAFRGHLRLLEDGGWEVIDLERLLARLAGDEPASERAALLTFDDGFLSTASALVELLEGRPAVFFVPTDYIGCVNAWNAETAEPREAICDVDALRALEHAGVSVQSHAASHRAFSTLSPRDQASELARSKRTLEEALGKTVEAVAYPYGDPGRDLDALDATLTRQGYRAGFLYGGGCVRLAKADRFRLSRIAIGSDTHLERELATP